MGDRVHVSNRQALERSGTREPLADPSSTLSILLLESAMNATELLPIADADGRTSFAMAEVNLKDDELIIRRLCVNCPPSLAYGSPKDHVALLVAHEQHLEAMRTAKSPG